MIPKMSKKLLNYFIIKIHAGHACFHKMGKVYLNTYYLYYN